MGVTRNDLNGWMATGDLLCVSLHDKVGFSAIFHAFLHGTIIFMVESNSARRCSRYLTDLEGRWHTLKTSFHLVLAASSKM